MTVEADEYLTLTEASELLVSLRISRRTLQRYAAAGRLGAYRVGRDFRIPRSTVERILAVGLSAVMEGED